MTVVVRQKDDYTEIINAARVTVGKSDILSSQNKELVARIIRAEHSPIRLIRFEITFENIPYWVSVHFVRHKIGVEHFVSTQRVDRTGKERGMQDDPVKHRLEANIQALINISRKRLCNKASKETRELWEEVVSLLPPEVQSSCVAECVYRGFCPEMKSCKYTESWQYKEARTNYINYGTNR